MLQLPRVAPLETAKLFNVIPADVTFVEPQEIPAPPIKFAVHNVVLKLLPLITTVLPETFLGKCDGEVPVGPGAEFTVNIGPLEVLLPKSPLITCTEREVGVSPEGTVTYALI